MIQEMLYLPPLASAHGGALDSLTFYVHLLMALLFVGWGIYFVVALMRFRAAKHPKADPAGVKSHTYRYAEYGVIVADMNPLPGRRGGPGRAALFASGRAVCCGVAREARWSLDEPLCARATSPQGPSATVLR